MHRDRVEDALDRPGAARLTTLWRRIAYLLEQLKDVSVRTTVLVDRHLSDSSSVPTRSIAAGLPLRSFELQQLGVARSVLEGGKAGPGRTRAFRSPAAGGCENGGGADEAAEQERAEAVALRIGVHGTIVRWLRSPSARSATCYST
jgi:hypothetical protein